MLYTVRLLLVHSLTSSMLPRETDRFLCVWPNSESRAGSMVCSRLRIMYVWTGTLEDKASRVSGTKRLLHRCIIYRVQTKLACCCATYCMRHVWSLGGGFVKLESREGGLDLCTHFIKSLTNLMAVFWKINSVVKTVYHFASIGIEVVQPKLHSSCMQ